MLPQTTTEQRAPRKYKRDEQVRRIVIGFRHTNPHLNHRRWTPMVKSLSQVTMLIARAYEHLRDKGILNEAGEIRESVDRFRRLVETQRTIMRELGISPSVTLPNAGQKPVLDLEAVREQFDSQD